MAITKEQREDARRGRPDVDLSGWAASRGLEFMGQKSALNYLGAFTWSPALQYNAVRGQLPGGERGVLLHQVQPWSEIDAQGLTDPTGGVGARGMVPRLGDIVRGMNPLAEEPERWVMIPHTAAAVRVPEATGAIFGLSVARTHEPHQKQREPWRGVPAGRGWTASCRKHSDETIVRQVLDGPVREALQGELGPLFEIHIEYGLVKVSQQHFLKRPEELDAFAQRVCTLARGVRQICATRPPQPFDVTLPPPNWLPAVEANPGGTHVLDPPFTDPTKVVAVARERNLALEDAHAFHRAFPQLPVPGEAFAVFRGELPRTGLSGRLLCCAERRMRVPTDLEQAVDAPVGGPVGSDVALLPVRRDAPATGDVDGERVERLRVVVRDGVLTVWTLRALYAADGSSRGYFHARGELLDELSAQTVELARQRGLLDGSR